MLRKFNYILILASLVVLSSCGASKRLSYLTDLEKLETIDVTAEPDLKVSPNDRLEITDLQEPCTGRTVQHRERLNRGN